MESFTFCAMIISLSKKCRNTEFFLVRIFLYSVWIQENKKPEKSPYLNIFQGLLGQHNLIFEMNTGV